MINPQPVHTPHSPYRTAGDSPRPTIVGTPSSSPGSPSPKKPKKGFRWKRMFGLAFLGLMVGTSTYAYAMYRNLTGSIIQGHEGESSEILNYDPSNAKAKLDASKFLKAGDGRFNMVIAGQGGENHPGGTLTDSIQVMSLDTINSEVSFTSIPRDLYVSYNGARMKVNTVYSTAERNKAGSGAVALRDITGQVLGVKVSNFALIDFTGIKQIVDALGGIEVDVPKALNDPLYPAPDMVKYDPFSVKAGLQTMNGDTALKYARSRETTSDFDRSKRQQIIIAAIKKKATSAGVLTNPAKISNLIAALGKHFKTDVQTENLFQLINLYRQVTPEKTTGYVLDTSSSLGLLTSASSPGYINYPVLGYDKYEAIHQWFQKNNPDPLLKREGPSITVYNSGKATVKQFETFIQKLKDYGYTVTIGTDPAASKVTTLKIVAKSPDAKPISYNYLGALMGSKIEKGSIGSNITTDFEMVYVPTTTAANAKKPSPSPSSSASPKSSPTP